MDVCGKRIRVSGRLVRIARLDGDRYEFIDDPEALLGDMRKSGTRIDLFTFMQKLPETVPKYRYPMEWDNVAALPVSTFDAWWTKQVNAKTRNIVRKSERKGVEVREMPFDDKLVQGIREIYNESPVRQGKPNRHHGKDIATVRREAATFLEKSIWIGARLNTTLIGFAKLVIEPRTQAGLMNLVTMVRHRDTSPSNALIAEAVRACAGREIPYLVYARFAYGSKLRDSLSDFKRNNGFQRIDLPRYYVPLTHLGSAALRLGLHKRFAEHLPEPVLAELRRLRQAWYKRKLRSVAGPS